MFFLFVLLAIALLIVYALFASARGRIDRTTVPALDLDRYMGEWYEIARFDRPFERHLNNVTALYRKKPNGRVEVVNRGIDSRTGKERVACGKVRPGREPGVLKVSFFWIFYSDYRVLELAPDYSWALVGGSTAASLWVLARASRLPRHELDRILELARQRGYDTSRLLFTQEDRKTPARRKS